MMKVRKVRLSPVHPTRKAVLECEGMETSAYGIKMPDGWVVTWDYVVEFEPVEEKSVEAGKRPGRPAKEPKPGRKATSARRGRKAGRKTQES